VRAMVADMKVHVSNDPESVSAAVVYSIDTDPRGFPSIWDLALRSENVTTDPPPPQPSWPARLGSRPGARGWPKEKHDFAKRLRHEVHLRLLPRSPRPRTRATLT